MYLSCGEALYDMFASDGANAHPYAVHAAGVVGGSPLNVALGLARMGNASGLLTRMSTDALGRKITEFMQANGISRDFLITTDTEPTTLAFVYTRPDGQPDYAFYSHGTASCTMQPGDTQALPDDDVRLVHLGSFAPVVEPSGSVLRDYARICAKDRFISYDPNVRLVVEPDLDRWRATINEMLPIADYVKASDEDLELLYPGQPMEAFAEKALMAGAELAVITRGADGAIIASADGRLMHVPGIDVKVADTVGAGDTFMAASLHFLGAHGGLAKKQARNVDIAAFARFAVHAAGLTCTRRGADLPTLADIDAVLAPN